MHESGGANTAGSLKLNTSAVAIFFFSWSSGDTYSLPYGRLPVGRATLSSVRPSFEFSVAGSELVTDRQLRTANLLLATLFLLRRRVINLDTAAGLHGAQDLVAARDDLITFLQ